VVTIVFCNAIKGLAGGLWRSGEPIFDKLSHVKSGPRAGSRHSVLCRTYCDKLSQTDKSDHRL